MYNIAILMDIIVICLLHKTTTTTRRWQLRITFTRISCREDALEWHTRTVMRKYGDTRLNPC